MSFNFEGKLCPYCQCTIAQGDKIVVCSACKLPHHAECWEENAKCTTLACTGRALEAEAAVGEEASERVNLAEGIPCPECARLNALDANFCAGCGRKIADVEAAAPVIFCSRCGRENSRQNRFCVGCGAGLGVISPVYANAGDAYAPPYENDSAGVHYGTEEKKWRYPRASISNRVLATLTDWALYAAVLFLAMFLVTLLDFRGRYSEQSISAAGVALLIFCGMVMTFYLFFKDGLGNGQSFGKRLWGLMVVRVKDNQPCKFSGSVLRSLAFLIPYSLLFELALICADDRGVRVGDRFAGTQVIEKKLYKQEQRLEKADE